MLYAFMKVVTRPQREIISPRNHDCITSRWSPFLAYDPVLSSSACVKASLYFYSAASRSNFTSQDVFYKFFYCIPAISTVRDFQFNVCWANDADFSLRHDSRTLPLVITTKNLPYFLTEKLFHLGITVLLLRGGPLFWHVTQFYHHQPASRLRSIFILLHPGQIFSFLGCVPQIVLVHSSYLYCS